MNGVSTVACRLCHYWGFIIKHQCHNYWAWKLECGSLFVEKACTTTPFALRRKCLSTNKPMFYRMQPPMWACTLKHTSTINELELWSMCPFTNLKSAGVTRRTLSDMIEGYSQACVPQLLNFPYSAWLIWFQKLNSSVSLPQLWMMHSEKIVLSLLSPYSRVIFCKSWT